MKKLGEESWDVIRLQVCGGSVVNWPSLYRRVIAHLRPDAWFEQVDIDFEPKCEDRTVGGSALYNWYCKLSQATSDAARPISHQFQATIDHLRNAGFTDVEHKQFILPLNKWHPDSRMRTLAAGMAALSLRASNLSASPRSVGSSAGPQVRFGT
ncbi:LaeA-like regulator of secondary metabolism, putative [Aspergillus udagawae]|nr:LaeA-like regulator of secondary metabolism, putative [Aspergillus udagawae]